MVNANVLGNVADDRRDPQIGAWVIRSQRRSSRSAASGPPSSTASETCAATSACPCRVPGASPSAPENGHPRVAASGGPDLFRIARENLQAQARLERLGTDPVATLHARLPNPKFPPQ